MSGGEMAMAIAAASMIGGAIGGWIQEGMMRSEAIRRGFAHYDSKTGRWQWNDAALVSTREQGPVTK